MVNYKTYRRRGGNQRVGRYIKLNKPFYKRKAKGFLRYKKKYGKKLEGKKRYVARKVGYNKDLLQLIKTFLI